MQRQAGGGGNILWKECSLPYYNNYKLKRHYISKVGINMLEAPLKEGKRTKYIMTSDLAKTPCLRNY
jgi:hypothetical protein